jgi:hypothetical protein
MESLTDTLATEGIKLLFFLLTLAITVVVPPLLVKIYRRLGMSEEQARLAAEQTQELADRMKVRNLLLGVEEWAASKIKAAQATGDGGAPITSRTKLEKFISDAGAAGLDIAKAIRFAHEELPKLGLGSAGAQAQPKEVTVGAVSVSTLPR